MKLFIRVKCFILIIMYVFMFFCLIPPSSSDVKLSSTFSSENGNLNTISNPTPLVQIEHTSSPDLEMKAIQSFDEFNKTDLPIISAIPDEKIFLYGIKENMGVVLYYKGRGHFYDWGYLTPRFILPKMYYSDFDKDGSKEIAIILYIGSGTGVSVEVLHVVKVSGSEYLSENSESKDYLEPNPEYFKDNCFSSDKYIAQVSKAVKFEVHKQDDGYKAELKISGERFSITPEVVEKDDGIENSYSIGDIVDFDFKGNKLVAKFVIGFKHTLYATPQHFGEVFADISYIKGKFMLENFRFEEYKNTDR